MYMSIIDSLKIAEIFFKCYNLWKMIVKTFCRNFWLLVIELGTTRKLNQFCQKMGFFKIKLLKLCLQIAIMTKP